MVEVAENNAVYYYHFDGLGSVVALSDVNSVLVERYTYDVFGRPTIRDANGTEIAASVFANPQSAALCLVSELVHAYHDNMRRTGKLDKTLTRDAYDDIEERNTIVNEETCIALELGEGTRSDHRGTLFPVNGVTDRPQPPAPPKASPSGRLLGQILGLLVGVLQPKEV